MADSSHTGKWWPLPRAAAVVVTAVAGGGLALACGLGAIQARPTADAARPAVVQMHGSDTADREG
ncbi:hypothetical protein [Nocardia nova]|uniref:hypothetical protein n=1 Tax=Nocardia nova TaxID=37330 RepID=UPI0033F5EDCF